MHVFTVPKSHLPGSSLLLNFFAESAATKAAIAESCVGYPQIVLQMNPDQALNQQIQRYRRMTSEQRLAIALGLHELSCNVAREGIRQQNPDADGAAVERLLRRRLKLVRQ